MSMADDPLPDLIRGLKSPIADQRVRCARAVGRLGVSARESVPLLMAATRDQDPAVREAAAQAVGLMGITFLPQIVQLLHHEDKYVRRHAVWAIGKQGAVARSAVPALCEALRDVDPRTASGAAQSLGSMGEDAADAVPALIDAMRGTNIVLCRLAAKALSQVGTPALGALVANLRHRDPFVRGEAALALGWIGAGAAVAIPELIGIVTSRQPILTSIPTPPNHQTPATAIAPTPPPPNPEESSCLYAVQALGRIGPAAIAAVPVLQQVCQEPQESLRQAATLSLKQIRGY